MTLTHRFDRSVFILAPRATVFTYFQDSARWAQWWGAGSTIDPRSGGKVYVCYPNNVEASGDVLEVSAPERIVYTYGYASGQPMGPGASRVTITLTAEGDGTRLRLMHECADASVRDQHAQGWRFQVSVLVNLVANGLHAAAGARADAWFAAWSEPDDARRREAFATIAAPDVRVGDKWSLLDGIDEVSMHAGAAQRFMPGMVPQRTGDARHCLGTALVDWTVPGPDGQTKARGTSVFTFGPAGEITSVTGFWG